MIEEYFGLREKPFALTPDPRFFYLSNDHLEALEHLIYGINEGEGFLLLVGEIGTGKTTLSRVLVEKLSRDVVFSLILNPFQDFFNLLKNILWDLGLIPEGLAESELINQLLEFILHEVGPQGKKVLIIIDEAQNLSDDTLEKLRILSNFETDKEKLLQILLLGQEELLQKLEAPHLRQLNQRISIRYFLSPLKKSEIGHYLQHRLKAAGASRELKFTRGALNAIYKISKGVPRIINMLAARCLVAAFVRETDRLDRKAVLQARDSLFGEKYSRLKKISNGGTAKDESKFSRHVRWAGERISLQKCSRLLNHGLIISIFEEYD